MDEIPVKAVPTIDLSIQEPALSSPLSSKISRLDVSKDSPAAVLSAGMAQIDVKAKKLVYSEKKLKLDILPFTIAQLCSFHSWLQEHLARDGGSAFSGFSGEHEALLICLFQESELEMTKLCLKIYDSLFPNTPEEILEKMEYVSVIQKTIKSLGERVNYGVQESGFPPSFNIWRWEAKGLDKLPQDMREMLIARRESRKQTREEISSLLDKLDPETKSSLKTSKSLKRKLIDDEEKQRVSEEKKKQKEMERKLEKEKKKLEKEQEKIEKKQKELEKKLEKDKKQGNILNFFKKTTPPPKESKDESIVLDSFDELFRPFHLKPNAVLAPCNHFKTMAAPQGEILDDIKSRGPLLAHKSSNRVKLTKVNGFTEPFYVVMKLLKFDEDIRPAYFGSFRKELKGVGFRRPFVKDTNVFDYEVDSGDEWEDEGDGESLTSSEGEEHDLSDAEVDSEAEDWLVPTGYLSEDEGMEGNEAAETKKITKKLEKSSKKLKLSQLVPTVIGPILKTEDQNETLKSFQAIFLDQLEPFDPFEVPVVEEKENKPPVDPFTPDLLTVLAKLVDDNPTSINILVDDFFTQTKASISRKKLENKINEIGFKKKLDGEALCWHLREEFECLLD
ncbi:hypothetical protein O9G_003164 [Rozella allomycis CSF55]|uniref:Chromatin assembly factor 1 subunit A dimerization domain-containing protein n=1 Tax=Rozella allomycis (strain CSF55) TaxID=988480 RepID=A0A075AZY9_ROZAC|nr:hypothetical protein O9G_003164 [Rozella allomycis CSF55]|eukprot:EPZ34084.1 hypothetical protein O9G_003164 [Rozella allomycis CSF55]